MATYTRIDSWLTFPVYVTRRRMHDGFFVDKMNYPGFAAEREARLSAQMESRGIQWRREPAEFMKAINRRWEECFGEASPEDVFIFTGEDPETEYSPANQQEATERLAAGLSRSWAPKANVQSAIQERSRAEGDDRLAVKNRATQVGLSLALRRMAVGQHIRFGNQWVVGPDAERCSVVPVDTLAASLFIRWFHRQAVAEAEADLLDEPARDTTPTPSPETVPLEDDLLLEDVAPGPLDDFILSTIDLESLLAAAHLSPAERKLVDAFLHTAEWPDAARHLNIPLATMRKRKERLLAKLRASSP